MGDQAATTTTDTTTTTTAPAGAGGEGGSTTTTDDKKFDQETLDRVAAREKDQGARAKEQEIATALGMSVEEARKIIDERREADKAKLTEAERAAADAEAAKQAAELDRNEAKRDRHNAAVERALILAKVDDKLVAKAARLVEANVGDDTEAITAAVETLKSEFPALFAEAGTTTTTTTRPAPASKPAGGPPAQQHNNDPFTAAFEKGRQSARPPQREKAPA